MEKRWWIWSIKIWIYESLTALLAEKERKGRKIHDFFKQDSGQDDGCYISFIGWLAATAISIGSRLHEGSDFATDPMAGVLPGSE